MTSKRLPFIHPLLALLFGCSGQDDSVTERLTLQSASVEHDVCPDDRYVARRANPGQCSSITHAGGEWKGERLFGPESNGAMARYCLYEWEGLTTPPAFPAVAWLESVASDCQGIIAEADAMSSVLQPILRDIFHTNIGRVKPEDLGLSAQVDKRAPITIAVVDTMPSHLPSNPRSKHGESMARIIGDIACPGGYPSCVVDVPRVLGLPRWENGIDTTRGGVIGTFSDVARGIHSAVRDWEIANAGASEPSPLIVNLSLGWESELFGGTEPVQAMDATSAAVYAALEYASCRGALVVAAAGNDNGICAVGPTLPGGWETRPAPTLQRCQQLGVLNPVVDPGPYRPLVHAVAATDITPGPMPRTRPGSRPRLVAQGTHAVAGDPPTPGLTGTSVATAAVSGAAALVWSINPSLSPSQVMQRVYDEGAAVPGLLSQVRLQGQPAVPVRRLDACAAVTRVCSDLGAACPLALPLGCTGAPPLATLDDVFAALPQVPLGPPHQPTFTGPLEVCEGPCGEELEMFVADGEIASCEAVVPDPTLVYSRPQPGSIVCATCTLTNNVVTVALNEEFAQLPIHRVVVTIHHPERRSRPFDLGAPVLSSTPATPLRLDETLMFPEVQSATIAFTFADGRTITDPLILL